MFERRILIVSFLVVAFAGEVSAQDFQPIVKGDGLDQFSMVNLGPDSLTIEDGEIRLSGKPDGYFATRASYKNYILRFEWAFDRPQNGGDTASFLGNSGVLLHIVGPAKVWPTSIESQLLPADLGNLFPISGAEARTRKDVAAQRKAMKPPGEWNAHEIRSRDGTLISIVNGFEISRASNAVPDQGAIGWQSEGAPIRFRKLMILPTK